MADSTETPVISRREDGSVETYFQMNACTEQLALNRQHMEKALQMAEIAENVISQVILAVDESIANVMEHAVSKEEKESFEIRLDLLAESDRILIQISDPGKNFNPSSIQNPDMKSHVAAGKKGGLGIFIIRKIMDTYQHDYVDGHNVITLEKKLKSV